jgi:hypothetical protein
MAKGQCAHGKWYNRACPACKRTTKKRVKSKTSFGCSACPKSFIDRDKLQKHKLRTHTPSSEWPISCPGCAKKFVCKTSAKAHILGEAQCIACSAFGDDESRTEAVVATRQQHDDATKVAGATFVGPSFSF